MEEDELLKDEGGEGTAEGQSSSYSPLNDPNYSIVRSPMENTCIAGYYKQNADQK